MVRQDFKLRHYRRVDRLGERAYLAWANENGREPMDEDVFNMSVRKFLKKVGVTAQREIETAVRAAIADGRLTGDGKVSARATITLEGLGTETVISGDIELV